MKIYKQHAGGVQALSLFRITVLFPSSFLIKNNTWYRASKFKNIYKNIKYRERNIQFIQGRVSLVSFAGYTSTIQPIQRVINIIS